MTIERVVDPTIDKFGVKYSDYPHCPSCEENHRGWGRVGRNGFWLDARRAGRDTLYIPEYYCYECCNTF
jgi:hypothetical protein